MDLIKILDDLGIEEKKRFLYSLDKNGGLIVPSPDTLFNAGFINESDFTYQEWLDKKEIMTEPTVEERIKSTEDTLLMLLDMQMGGI